MEGCCYVLAQGTGAWIHEWNQPINIVLMGLIELKVSAFVIYGNIQRFFPPWVGCVRVTPWWMADIHSMQQRGKRKRENTCELNWIKHGSVFYRLLLAPGSVSNQNSWDWWRWIYHSRVSAALESAVDLPRRFNCITARLLAMRLALINFTRGPTQWGYMSGNSSQSTDFGPFPLNGHAS